jgi:hydrogenase maturation protease
VILVAGIGNIFLGDDGFGSEAARRLALRIHSPEIRVVDFGIRGFDFAYALLEGYAMTIILDAVQRSGKPGTIYVIEPDLDAITDAPPALDAHIMDPMRVLALARSMGAELQKIRIVGCEPETFGPDNEGHLGLSHSVSAAVEEAIAVVESLIDESGLKEAAYDIGMESGQ